MTKYATCEGLISEGVHFNPKHSHFLSTTLGPTIRLYIKDVHCNTHYKLVCGLDFEVFHHFDHSFWKSFQVTLGSLTRIVHRRVFQ